MHQKNPMPIPQSVGTLVSAVESGREGAKGKAEHSAAVDEIDSIMGERCEVLLIRFLSCPKTLIHVYNCNVANHLCYVHKF
jgi:hypothetical protein